MKRKMKQWFSMFLVVAMVLTLMPTNIASAEELSEPTEAITEATTEVTTEAGTEVITEVATEEEATEAITEVTTETMEEVSTEETSEELITEEEPVVALEGEEGLLGATSHKACASCQANLTLTMHTNNSSWYQSIVNNRVTAKNHALNDGYSGACASFVSYLLIDAGISGVSATPSCENLYSQLKNGAGGYTEIMLLWLVSLLMLRDFIHHLLMREILLILHLVLIYPKSPERYIARTISIPHGSL